MKRGKIRIAEALYGRGVRLVSFLFEFSKFRFDEVYLVFKSFTFYMTIGS